MSIGSAEELYSISRSILYSYTPPPIRRYHVLKVGMVIASLVLASSPQLRPLLVIATFAIAALGVLVSDVLPLSLAMSVSISVYSPGQQSFHTPRLL